MSMAKWLICRLELMFRGISRLRYVEKVLMIPSFLKMAKSSSSPCSVDWVIAVVNCKAKIKRCV